MRKMTCAAVAISLGMLPGCARLDHLGRAPTFSDTRETPEHFAMLSPGLPVEERGLDHLFADTAPGSARSRRTGRRGVTWSGPS